MYKDKIKERFDALASSYSDRAIPFILKRRVECLKRYNKEGDKILEIGCGSGNVLQFLKGERYGIDISNEMVNVAKERLGIETANSDAEFLPFKDEIFDVVVISEVLYYLEGNERVIKESFRCLKKDGRLLITSLSKSWKFLDNVVNLFKIGVHDDVSLEYPNLGKLKLELEKYFKIEEVRGIPFYYTKVSPIFFIAARK